MVGRSTRLAFVALLALLTLSLSGLSMAIGPPRDGVSSDVDDASVAVDELAAGVPSDALSRFASSAPDLGEPVPHFLTQPRDADGSSLGPGLQTAVSDGPASRPRSAPPDGGRAHANTHGGPHISGTVTQPNGSAASGVAVQAYAGGAGALCCSFVASAVTSAAGAYSIPVTAGTFRLLFIPPAGLASVWWSSGASFSAATDVVVVATDVTRDPLQLASGVTLGGTVSASPAPSTTPQIQAYVGGANALCCDLVTLANAAANGSYSLAVASGTYRLRFVPRGTTPFAPVWFDAVPSFTLATDVAVSGANVTGKNVTLPTGFHITGTVTDGAAAVANVRVQAYVGGAAATCCAFVTSALTNSSGSYSLLVANGTYRVRFVPPSSTSFLSQWFPSAPRFELATDVGVSGADVGGKNAALVTGFHITGTVTDGSAAVANVRVQAYVGGAAATCCTFVTGALTDGSGAYSLLVANGTYRVRFVPPGATGLLPQWWNGARRFDFATDVVVNGADVGGKDAVLVAGFTIGGTVTAAASGSPLADISVNAYLGGPGSACCVWITGARTDASGAYSLLVPNGTYRLRFFVVSGSYVSEWWSGARRFNLATDVVVNGANVAARDAALSTGFRLSGTVTDQNGAVLKDVAVNAYTGGAAAVCCTWVAGNVTNDAGQFGTVVPNGTYRLQFYPLFSNHLAEWWNDMPRFDMATDIVVNGADVSGKDAVLATGFRISGTVSDAATPSTKLEGISVSAFLAGPGAVCCTWFTGTSTNGLGQYSLLGPPGTYRLHFFSHSGSYIHRWWPSARRFELATDVVVSAADVIGKDAALASGFHVRGTLTDAQTTAPIQGASVNVFVGGPGARCCAWLSGALTNSVGSYDLVVPNGTYRVLFFPHEGRHVPKWWTDARRFELAADVVVNGADVSGRDAALTPGFRISGTIAGTFGVGIEGAAAAVFQGGAATCCTFLASSRPTDASGRYSVIVPSGTYRVLFFPHASDHIPAWWNGARRFELAADIVVSGADLDGKNAVLVRGVRISGRVTDASGAPLEGVFVQAFVGGAGASCCAFVTSGRPTSVSGEYSLVVPSGTYRLRFSAAAGNFVPQWWSGAARFDQAADVAVTGTDVGGKDVTLATGLHIRGTVTAVGGGALEGVSVSAYAGGPAATCCAWLGGTLTNAAGQYDLIVLAGTYRLRFFARTGSYVSEWWDDVGRFQLAKDVTAAGSDVVGKDAALAQGFRITGTLTSASGAALEGISVNAYAGGAGTACCTWIAGASTNANGQYTLVVPNGTYRLWFYPRSGSFVAKWWTTAATFEAANDLTVNGADVSGKDATLSQ